MVSVDTPSRIIVANPRRSIEEGDLLVSSKVISDRIGQCIVKIRKAGNSNILTFKISHHHCQKFSLHGLLVVILELKARNQNRKALRNPMMI